MTARAGHRQRAGRDSVARGRGLLQQFPAAPCPRPHSWASAVCPSRLPGALWLHQSPWQRRRAHNSGAAMNVFPCFCRPAAPGGV